jgi:aryl-alcohol dehydrogenase-like predicted oxidoreductase
VPIPGVKRSETLRDSAGAPDVVLTGADLAAIAAAGSTAGMRYNEMGMARVKL